MKFPKMFRCLHFAALFCICSSAASLVEGQSSSSAHPRIINGTPAASSEFPFMASLFFTGSSPDEYGGHFCGGTLIAPDLVLTAAHCVSEFVQDPYLVSLVIGRTQLSTQAGHIRYGTEIYIHPEYNDVNLRNDSALVRLNEAVSGISPAQLVGPRDTVLTDGNSPATIIGWGSVDEKWPAMPDHLQKADIIIRSDASCRSKYGIVFTPAKMLCAGTLESAPNAGDGVDACYGDSGGPLLVKDGAAWKVAGLTSFGFDGCAGSYYGVYTEVASQRDFIDAIESGRGVDYDAPVVERIRLFCLRRECVVQVFAKDPRYSSGIRDVIVDAGYRGSLCRRKTGKKRRVHGQRPGNPAYSYGNGEYLASFLLPGNFTGQVSLAVEARDNAGFSSGRRVVSRRVRSAASRTCQSR